MLYTEVITKEMDIWQDVYEANKRLLCMNKERTPSAFVHIHEFTIKPVSSGALHDPLRLNPASRQYHSKDTFPSNDNV